MIHGCGRAAEEISNLIMLWEKAVDPPRGPEALHDALASSGWLESIFGSLA
jgi:hypothetical protein